ncbi:MAG: iron-containing alcohol dehydrogenase, partial [Anaerolineales bacterium]
AAHGATCAALLPHVMAVNLQVIRGRDSNVDLAARFDEIGRILTGNPAAVGEDGVAWLMDLCEAMEVPSLGSHGLTHADFPALIEKAIVSSSMKGNPVQLTKAEMTEILKRAM